MWLREHALTHNLSPHPVRQLGAREQLETRSAVTNASTTGEAVLAIDQGTTNSKAVLVDAGGEIVGSGSAPVGLTTPAPGWVEQSGERIWESVLQAVQAAVGGTSASIVGVGLSTQR